MWRYYELLTDLAPSEIAALKDDAGQGRRNPRDLKAELGRRVVADFHSPAAAEEASAEFDKTFRDRQAPSDIPRGERPATAIRLVKLLTTEGLAPSGAQAQRLIIQGSVQLDGQKIDDVKYELEPRSGQETLIKVGKRRFLRVRFT